MNPQDATAILDQSLQSIRDVPWMVHLPAIVALIAGCMLCLKGARLVRPVYMLAFAALGGALGVLIVPRVLSDSVMGVPSPLIGVVAGALVGLLIAAFTYRLALAVASGFACACAGAIISTVYLSTVPGSIPSFQASKERLVEALGKHTDEAKKELESGLTDGTIQREWQDTKDRLSGKVPAASSDESVEPFSSTAARRTRQFFDDLRSEVGEAWTQLPGESKTTMSASTVGAGVLGFVLGLLAPKRGAAIMTSLAGAALVMVGGIWLMYATGYFSMQPTERTPLVILCVWVGLSLAGFVSQLPRKAAPKPAPEPAPKQ
jgi:hypothetical protein